MAPVDLARGAQSHFDVEGIYALSVYCAAEKTAAEIADRVPLPHSFVRQSTVGRLRDAGYEVVPSPGPPAHADLVLPDPPTDVDWEMLDVLFDPPHPNPARMRSEDV